MIAIAIAAQLGDLVTFLIMGVEYEANSLVSGTPIWISAIAKLLLICVVCLVSIAASMKHPRVVLANALLILAAFGWGALGTISNLGVIL